MISQMQTPPPHHFEFLLFDRFSNMALANVMEPLRALCAGVIPVAVSWTVSTLSGAPAHSSSGLAVSPDHTFDPIRPQDTLVLVAGYDVPALCSPDLLAQLRQACRRARRVIAIDTASWMLAAAGLLQGQRATVHWQAMDDFAEAFPEVDLVPTGFARSGRFLSSGGAGTTLDMTLDLIQRDFGAAAAFEVSNLFLFDAPRCPGPTTEAGLGSARLRRLGSPRVLRALDVMADHTEEVLSTHQLAARVATSERSLSREFQRELGMTPGKYYRLFRLQKARLLARESRLSQDQIALRCGFSSGAALTRAHRQNFGQPFRALRAGPQSHSE